MPLTRGTRLGVYEVTALIGEGGMGQVYRARDTALNRDVALKILPDAFVGDPDRLARFTREARTLASLNHPHIAAIYGIEQSQDARALVMELVEGEDLSQRVARGAIPLDEALPIARQIAEALEAAHEQGIIHRDLKPANIKVRPDGTVKVLDFGLAKAMDPVGAMSPNVSQSPTITTPAMSHAANILGTAAYMSPEQARGKSVDKRSDVWALGCVLYEMLTGHRAFEAEDVSLTLAEVMKSEPDWARLPSVSGPVDAFLRQSLRKDPRQRVQSIGDMRLALEGAFETVASQTTASATSSAPRGQRALVVILAVGVIGMVAMATPMLRNLRETPPPAPAETRADIVTPDTDSPASFALSPDGRQIVFVSSGDGASRLWLRSLATTTAQPLTGTDGARFPFWSPDGRAVGFFAGGALKRLDLGGSVPQTLAPALNGSGGTWNADGVIVFAPSRTTPLMRVSATGGAATALTTLGPQHQGHIGPSLLPDGRRLLFTVRGPRDMAGIYLGGLDAGTPTRLTPADTTGVYLPNGPGSAGALRGDGWLLWMRAGTLVAQRLDLAKAALTGEPVTVADGLAVDPFNRSAVSVAANGLVAYRAGAGTQRQLTWVDRAGNARGTVGNPDGSLIAPSVSPDGRRVAVWRVVEENADIWVLDGTRMSRFTFDAAADWFPMWSSDGSEVVFDSNRKGHRDLYQKSLSGASDEELLMESSQDKLATDWSANGRFILYHSRDPETDWDLWVLPINDDRKPWAFLKTRFNERYAQFSPDGRWVAYMSNESGRQMEIYIRPFTQPGASGPAAFVTAGQRQVSTEGGIFPVWRPDGKELYYLNPAGAMMAAPITGTAATLEPGAPVALFSTRIFGGGADVQQGRQYSVAPDGRFLINTVLDDAAPPITLLQNWQPDARK